MHSSEIFLAENVTPIHRRNPGLNYSKFSSSLQWSATIWKKRKSKNPAFYLTSPTALHKLHKTLSKTHILLLGSQARLYLRIHKIQIFTIQEETDTWSRTLTGKSKPIWYLMWYFTPNLTISRTARRVPKYTTSLITNPDFLSLPSSARSHCDPYLDTAARNPCNKATDCSVHAVKTALRGNLLRIQKTHDL